MRGTVEGYNFHYTLTGSRHNPALLFLHGFMGSSNDWTGVISGLADQFFCLAVDLPGHGQTRVSGGEDLYSMPNTARALIHFLDDLNIDKCFLTGYSMGGRLALYLALHFPSRFPKVILESASPGLKTESERSARRQSDQLVARQLETTDFKSFLLDWYSQPLFQTLQNHPEYDKIIECRLQENPLELAKSLRNMGAGSQPPLWDKLAQNKTPLLLLAGEYDHKFRAINAEMAELCQIPQLKIIPKSGHNIHLENLTEWLANVREFLG
ncbi:2-succinyl-6-hydroxy-2,4-cyclohexadiene-1-carboxylate synthase [Kamptonema formosum]|uniref:2-succinyl-6-hydroxy-2, 4-cyclohexadiene-1-carboxylate synthase n=1 Tax=Kamptonema formosum TaxID=331992 RepID=UPI0005C5CBFD|nr:2-succinyl-6-hydroxy-2,4-cyclohexadiene-1-carboxylate synthase [Oscillatoria sp. PCC 10802]